MADEPVSDQHFCLRWNNFQANLSTQFDALRCNEDFTDVTIACDGQKLLAHKVVLSACSPYFKELFKANPCSHPIVFMRDVEARHILALMEFMYVGEVNVSQAHLSAFLKTAESLKIRGLTDISSESDQVTDDDSLYMKPQALRSFRNNLLVSKNKPKNEQVTPTSTVTSSQDVPMDIQSSLNVPSLSSPPRKWCKSETEYRLRKEDSMTVNPFALQDLNDPIELTPKVELPDYVSEDEHEQDDISGNFYSTGGSNAALDQAQDTTLHCKDLGVELTPPGKDNRKLHSLDPRPCSECGKIYSNLSNLRQHMKLIHYPTFVTCSFCNKQFKTDLYLKRHIQSAHKNCEVCIEHSCTPGFNFSKFSKSSGTTKFKRFIRDI